MSKTTERPMAPLRHILSELGLISEEDYARITGTTEKTRESWRKHGKGFPAIRLGNEYYYPIPAAKDHVEQLIQSKISKQLDISDDFI